MDSIKFCSDKFDNVRLRIKIKGSNEIKKVVKRKQLRPSH